MSPSILDLHLSSVTLMSNDQNSHIAVYEDVSYASSENSTSEYEAIFNSVVFSEPEEIKLGEVLPSGHFPRDNYLSDLKINNISNPETADLEFEKLSKVEFNLRSRIKELEDENKSLKEKLNVFLTSSLKEEEFRFNSKDNEEKRDLNSQEIHSNLKSLESEIRNLNKKLLISREAEESLLDQISELEYEGSRRMREIRTNFEIQIHALNSKNQELVKENEKLKAENSEVKKSTSSLLLQMKAFEGESIWDRKSHGIHSKCFSDSDILKLRTNSDILKFN